MIVKEMAGGTTENVDALRATLILDLSGPVDAAELLDRFWHPIRDSAGVSEGAKQLVAQVEMSVPILRHRDRIDRAFQQLVAASERVHARARVKDVTQADEFEMAVFVEDFVASLDGPVPIAQVRKEYLEPLTRDRSPNPVLLGAVQHAIEAAEGASS